MALDMPAAACRMQTIVGVMTDVSLGQWAGLPAGYCPARSAQPAGCYGGQHPFTP